MPQLDKVTFLTQFVWLTVCFLALYYTLVTTYLPRVARLLKLRELKTQEVHSETLLTVDSSLLEHTFQHARTAVQASVHSSASWTHTAFAPEHGLVSRQAGQANLQVTRDQTAFATAHTRVVCGKSASHPHSALATSALVSCL